jgi:cytochrome c556
MKRLLIVVLTSLAVVALCWPSRGDADDQNGQMVKTIMEEKLKNAHKLLDGIALADFKKITNSVEELIQLSKTEEWMVLKTSKYELFNNEFQRAAGDIIAKAKAKNIDGVTLAYLDLTMSCVRCHSYVREVRAG